MKNSDRDELIEIETIQIALDDKFHRIFGELQKIKKLQKHTDERIRELKEKING